MITAKELKVLPNNMFKGELTEFTAFETWQKGVVRIVQSKAFKVFLTDIVRGVADPTANPDILLDALTNYFSYRNPGFEDNWWHFKHSDLTLHIGKSGMRFEHPDETNTTAAMLSKDIADLIGHTRWIRTFMGPYPKAG